MKSEIGLIKCHMGEDSPWHQLISCCSVNIIDWNWVGRKLNDCPRDVPDWWVVVWVRPDGQNEGGRESWCVGWWWWSHSTQLFIVDKRVSITDSEPVGHMRSSLLPLETIFRRQDKIFRD